MKKFKNNMDLKKGNRTIRDNYKKKIRKKYRRTLLETQTKRKK
jgi:hypothetical protein